VIFGNVGATAGSRLVSAFYGGADKAPLAALFGAAAMSTAFGAAAAASQWTVANAKNERRSDPDRVSFLAQLANSVLGPAWQKNQACEADQALQAAEDAASAQQRSAPLLAIEPERAPRDVQPQTVHETDPASDSDDSWKTALSARPARSDPATDSEASWGTAPLPIGPVVARRPVIRPARIAPEELQVTPPKDGA
jgi:hypothetical protein